MSGRTTDRFADSAQRVGVLDGIHLLARRHLGSRADDVEFVVEPSLDGRDRYTYSASGGRIRITGTDPVTIAVGLADYARSEAHASTDWDSASFLALPATPRDIAPVERSTELRNRYYLNFVTSGYSMPYWDWPRWERELDWMALHGVSLPLISLGHEAVLLETYRNLGLSEAAALEWIGGAAHLPWMFMGGTNRWGGPLSRHWIDRHVELALRVLDRARDLGMSPVLPGFSGHLPEALAPDGTRTIEWQGWHTPVLDPASAEFRQAAEAFAQAQRQLLGHTDYLAIDPFIESVPPLESPAELEEFASGIFAGALLANPDVTWILQGWPFHYRKEYWTRQRIEAFLAGIPRAQILLLDLWGEYAPIWPTSDGMWGRPWAWCMTHNFGGRPALFGDLAGLARDLRTARSAPHRGDLVGFGLTMEAIENNAVSYEYACDLVWEPSPDLATWLPSFAGRRYQTQDPAAAQAWEILAATLYAPGRTRSIPSPIIARPWTTRAPFAAQRLAGEYLDPVAALRPSANIDAENDPAVLVDLPQISTAARLLIDLATRLGTQAPQALLRDIAELTSHVVAQSARFDIRAILSAADAKDAPGIRAARDQLERRIDGLDHLAATRTDTRITTWIDAARAWAVDDADGDVLERDARSLISVWGTQSSGLHDYSGRHWSGLLRDYYAPRWRTWCNWLADAIEARTEPDEQLLHERIMTIEESWRQPGSQTPTRPPSSLLPLATELLDLSMSNRPATSTAHQ